LLTQCSGWSPSPQAISQGSTLSISAALIETTNAIVLSTINVTVAIGK
jgi:hypothetical protein